MLVVTNTKTKADAICRVVKVRTFSNTQGYVEVEFTTAQPNYWAVRFPSDGPAPVAAAPAAPVKSAAPAKPVEAAKPVAAPPAPVAPVAATPAVQAPKPAAPIAPAVVPPAPAPVAQTPKPVAPAASVAVVPPQVVPPVAQPVVTPIAKVESPVVATPVPAAAAPVSPASSHTSEVEDEDLDTILSRLSPAAPVAASPVPNAPSLDAIFTPKPPQPVASSPVVAEVPKPAPAIQFPAAPPPAPVPSLTLSELRGDSIAGASTDSDDTEVIEHDALLKQAATEPSVETPRRTFGSFSGGASLTGGSSLTATADASSSETDGSASRVESSSSFGSDYAAPPKQSNFLMIAACVGVLALVAGGGVFYFRTSVAGGKTAAPTIRTAESAKSPESEAAGETSEQTALRNTVAASNASIQPATSIPAAPVTAGNTATPSNPDLNVTPTPTRSHSARDEAAAKAIANVVDASANAHPVAAQRTDAGSPGAAPALDAPSGDSGNALSGLVSTNDGSNLKAPEIHVDGPVRVGGNVKEPQLISHVMPNYPLTAKEAGIQGDVVIQTTIDQHGNVVNMNVVSGPMMLRGPALEALKRWKYAPSTLNGQPIAVQMSVTVKFSNR
jgi:TonB family protein